MAGNQKEITPRNYPRKFSFANPSTKVVFATIGVISTVAIIITNYHRLKLVPVLSCLVLVNIFLNPGIEALPYSLVRIWDTAIGLNIGILVNIPLVFPTTITRRFSR